jgi:hypothetical protein
MNVVVDRVQIIAYLTLHEWRKAPADVKAVEGGARFPARRHRRRVARVALIPPAVAGRQSA